MDTEIFIPSDNPVRLLSAIMEEMDYSKLMATYSRIGRIEYSPRLLMKIMVYGYMRKIYSSRQLEAACRENINFMYLLEGNRPPDHNTIARFRRNHLSLVADEMLAQLTQLLMGMGEISFAKSSLFIDGTKIEACANRYQFVWKKSVSKNRDKLQERMQKELSDLLEKAGVRWHIPGERIEVHHLKKLRKRLYRQADEQGLKWATGKGHRKHPLQKALEKVNEWLEREKQYNRDVHICGDRNSYCKTDHDATFMRMKEDHMRNGQLKPGYNVNVATVSEYIVGNYISCDRSDVQTFIPFMKKLSDLPIERVTVDAGYESEENYRYAEEHEQMSLFVKPSNHETRKKRKYRTDISRRENMGYCAETDTYTCAQGKQIVPVCVRASKSASGYPIETTIYECSGCSGCPLKEKCIRAGSSKTPLEERSKRLYVSKYFQQQREKMEEKINTEEGIRLRVNRSIQAEGVFAFIKEDMDFRRFMLRGTIHVAAEWMLLSFAYNFWKLHHKIQNGRLGDHLKNPKAA
jgi:transposase